MKHVLVADDHTVVRSGVKAVLVEALGSVRFTEAATGDEVLTYLRSSSSDLLIMDLTMPGLDGLETLKKVKVIQPTLPVLVLSYHPEHRFAVRVLKAGGSGYITKERAADELVKAVRRILDGHTYVSSSLAEALAGELHPGQSGKAQHSLSDRETQVLQLLASGRTVSEIARHLHRSPKTISTHRTRILEKLGLRTTADLIRFAIEDEKPVP